ncbi:MAG: DNA-binding protein [Candidatus Bathyarchaeota archaeon B23]|nr:MAG: DNA-binding protein [Candidatus Bathyarchaeota archaeon B23]
MSDIVEEMGDTVIVGGKPIMNYVVACLTLFNAGRAKVKVRARGKNISRAVDVVELLKRVFIKDLDIKDIEIGTDLLRDEAGNQRGISTINIIIAKPGEQAEG